MDRKWMLPRLGQMKSLGVRNGLRPLRFQLCCSLPRSWCGTDVLSALSAARLIAWHDPWQQLQGKGLSLRHLGLLCLPSFFPHLQPNALIGAGAPAPAAAFACMGGAGAGVCVTWATKLAAAWCAASWLDGCCCLVLRSRLIALAAPRGVRGGSRPAIASRPKPTTKPNRRQTTPLLRRSRRCLPPSTNQSRRSRRTASIALSSST